MQLVEAKRLVLCSIFSHLLKSRPRAQHVGALPSILKCRLQKHYEGFAVFRRVLDFPFPLGDGRFDLSLSRSLSALALAVAFLSLSSLRNSFISRCMSGGSNTCQCNHHLTRHVTEVQVFLWIWEVARRGSIHFLDVPTHIDREKKEGGNSTQVAYQPAPAKTDCTKFRRKAHHA